jgi:hypothetical protein
VRLHGWVVKRALQPGVKSHSHWTHTHAPSLLVFLPLPSLSQVLLPVVPSHSFTAFNPPSSVSLFRPLLSSSTTHPSHTPTCFRSLHRTFLSITNSPTLPPSTYLSCPRSPVAYTLLLTLLASSTGLLNRVWLVSFSSHLVPIVYLAVSKSTELITNACTKDAIDGLKPDIADY